MESPAYFLNIVDDDGVNRPLSSLPTLDDMWDSMNFTRYDGGTVPRVEAWFNKTGALYTYGSGKRARTYEPQSEYPLMVNIVDGILSLKFDFNCCFVNGYENEKDFLGWHADDSPEMDMEHAIAIVSFGAEREIWFKRRDEKGEVPKENKVLLTDGSILIMPAKMQYDWLHRIPKHDKPCGRRISMTFRKII